MGEARKRRLTLIKGGKADEAKRILVAPERLVSFTFMLPRPQAAVLVEEYETKVDKETCPTLASFLVTLVEAGMIEFGKFYLEQTAPKPADIEVPQ